MSKNIKPIVKWLGGKTQIIDTVIKCFPETINNYHELFLGGGSILFSVLENNIKINGSINAYDINETLIYMYINIKNNYKEVLKEIKKIIDVYNSIVDTTIMKKPISEKDGLTSQESYYYWSRKIYNSLSQVQKNSPLGSAYFIFLNKTCFRGMHREGPHGFNVPFGHYNNPEIINEKHIEKVSELIKNVNFFCLPFEKSFEKVLENDFIYLDPPYVTENEKSFVKYNLSGFDIKQNKLLFSMCKKHKFLMSNSATNLIKEHFDSSIYKIKTIECKRSINSKKPDSKTNELLIMSY